MIQGFDIPIHQKEMFDRAFLRSQRLTSSLNLNLIPFATNFRQVIKLNWESVFNLAIASCLHFFKKSHGIGLIPSSIYFTKMTIPSAFDNITDAYVSSDNFTIVNDGSAFTRLQKTEQLLHWQAFKDNLRVCWEGEAKDRNCGQCEKCIRTILTFRILGSDLPSCFDADVSDRQIANLCLKGLGISTLAVY